MQAPSEVQQKAFTFMAPPPEINTAQMRELLEHLWILNSIVNYLRLENPESLTNLLNRAPHSLGGVAARNFTLRFYDHFVQNNQIISIKHFAQSNIDILTGKLADRRTTGLPLPQNTLLYYFLHLALCYHVRGGGDYLNRAASVVLNDPTIIQAAVTHNRLLTEIGIPTNVILTNAPAL